MPELRIAQASFCVAAVLAAAVYLPGCQCHNLIERLGLDNKYVAYESFDWWTYGSVSPLRDGRKFAGSVRVLVFSRSWHAKMRDAIAGLWDGVPIMEIVVGNSNVSLGFGCESDQPTEWIFYDETMGDIRRRTEWTEMKVGSETEPPGYVAWFVLEEAGFKFKNEEALLCRSTINRSHNILVRLKVDIRMEVVHIRRNQASDPLPPLLLLRDHEVASVVCGTRFEVLNLADVYYWRCSVDLLAADVVEVERGSEFLAFKVCHSAAYCANTYRDLRVPARCVNVSTPSSIVNLTWTPDLTAWKLMPQNLAGVAICLSKEVHVVLGAVEYFLAPVSKHAQRILYLSLADVQPSDLISLELDPNGAGGFYYTVEKLKMHCKVPKYGFSELPEPEFVVTLNHDQSMRKHVDALTSPPTNYSLQRSQITVINRVIQGTDNTSPVVVLQAEAHLELSGVYQVSCIAAAWKSVDLTTESITIEVHDVVRPYFEQTTQTVTYEEGGIDVSTQQRLTCDPIGDPTPDVSWGNLSSGIILNGSELAFTFIDADTMPELITCMATNKFGDTASKTFHVQVKRKPNLVLLVTGCVLGIFVLCGLATLYTRLLKRVRVAEQLLSDDEVKEFLEGRNAVAAERTFHYVIPLSELRNNQPLEIECLPYNSEFEVPKKRFDVDFDTELGSGQFGVVYEGQVKRRKKDRNRVPVAVKTVRRDADVEYFKALMSELKILAYIGHCEHVVNLVAAYSQNIKNRELYVGVEMCKTSLIDYLHDEDNRQTVKNGGTRLLVQWAAETAAGMEFVSLRRIVHGDLAARNVLISFDMRAKVGDFGLARQMIDYVYIKTQDCPLPWKWMAPESLTERTFSTKSDVWAYGVTLWELFSAGGVPYGDDMIWGPAFVQGLANGLRLPQPQYANNSVYSIMQNCWATDPSQ